MKLPTILIPIVLLFLTQSLGKIIPSIKPLEPKTIHISSTTGGISHIAWTLEIGKVLAERGHNVSFITTDPNVEFGVPYLPEIQTISMGPHLSPVKFHDLFDVDTPFSPSVRKAYKALITSTYKRDYFSYLDIFKSSNTSLAICDQMAYPCSDAARKMNIPLIVHMTMSISEDTKAPFINLMHTMGPSTTKDLSFRQRFYDQFVALPVFIYRFLPVGLSIRKVRKELGVKNFDPLSRHAQTIKMINSFWGMESPRPIGPFVEYVGPIIGSTYDSLPESMAQFMEEHTKVVYIAFGQSYSPNPLEFEVLLTSLLEAYESKYLDGFIWSFSMKSRQQPNLPKEIKTQSGRTYIIQDLFDGKLGADLRFEAWSPQFAILNHAHCRLFISHGGASSIHESLFNGVPLLLHPFTSDQPSNAISMRDAGVGLVLDRKAHNYTDTLEKIGIILNDKEGLFKSNMESMQSLVHLKSKRKYYAADMIEEVLYSVRNKSDIWYRREVVEHMSYLKGTNWDVNVTGIMVFSSFIIILCKTFDKICALYDFLFVPLKKYKTT